MHSIVVGPHGALVSKTLATVRPVTNIRPFLRVFIHVNFHLTLPATNVSATRSLTRKATFLVVAASVASIDVTGAVVIVCRIS